MPITILGITMGASTAPWATLAATDLRPFRTRAAPVAVTVATSATKLAISSELMIASDHNGSRKKFSYHLSDQPLGGKVKLLAEVKLRGMTTRDGATSQTHTAATQSRSHHRGFESVTTRSSPWSRNGPGVAPTQG